MNSNYSKRDKTNRPVTSSPYPEEPREAMGGDDDEGKQDYRDFDYEDREDDVERQREDDDDSDDSQESL